MWSSGLKKILLIDNTFDPPHGSPEIHARLEAAAKKFGPLEIVMARAPEEKIPTDLSSFSGAVLSGSKTRIAERAPWIQKEMDAIRDLYRRKIPTLGICYGEQLIALVLAGESTVGETKNFEHGWAEISQKANSPLFAGIPKDFSFYEFHRDEVKNLPANFRVTAANSACSVQAFDVLDAPMWGVQFHPERGLAEGNRSLDVQLKKDASYPALNREKAEKLFQPALADRLFENFLAQVWKQHS